MTVADDAIIEAENQVNFNWARTLPSHRAATHTMYALALLDYPGRLTASCSRPPIDARQNTVGNAHVKKHVRRLPTGAVP